MKEGCIERMYEGQFVNLHIQQKYYENAKKEKNKEINESKRYQTGMLVKTRKNKK